MSHRPFTNRSNQPPKSTPLRAIHNQSTPSTRTPLGNPSKNQPEINQNAHFVSTLTPTAQTTQLPTNQPLTPNFPSSPFCTSRSLPPIFSGKIPTSIGKLTMLEYLDIECCMFAGEIPKTISGLKNLRFLYGGQNLFSGSIPDDLMSLQKLNELAFEQNKLEGEIPATIGTLKELRYLDLSKNEISGQLPQSLVNLEALEGIYLHNNQIQGRIPDGFGEDKQPHLMRCDLSNNKLVGYLPKIVNRGWSKDMKSYPGHQYTEFVLKGNRLAGNIPSEYLQNSYLLSLIVPQQVGYSFHNYDLKDNFPSSK